MSILDRVLLFLFSLIGIVGGIMLALVGANILSYSNVFVSTPENVAAIIVGVIVILLSLRFLFYRVGRSQSFDYVAMTGDHGQIRISYETLQQLANRRGSQVKGTEGFDSRIRQGQDGIVILVKMQVLPDVDIASLSKEVQTAVNEYVEHTSGVIVERVLVHVTELSSAPRQGKAWNSV